MSILSGAGRPVTTKFAAFPRVLLLQLPMPQRPPGPRAGVRAPLEDKLTIDDDVFDTLVVLKGLLVSRAVRDSLLVEDRDVRKRSGLEPATIANAELGGVERSHFAHGILEP